MSHFIAHTVSFSKDRKTCRVKGGDNNVTPRSNVWSGEFPVSELLYDISSGSLKLTEGNRKNLIIAETAFKYKAEFGGSWEAENDLFHCSRYRGATVDSLRKDKAEILERSGGKLTAYDEKCLKSLDKAIENLPNLQKTLAKFEEDFVAELFQKLDNLDESEYVVTNGYSYVLDGRIDSVRFAVTTNENAAKRFNKEVAESIASRLKLRTKKV